MVNSTTYPLNELFETIQGEGVYTGIPAVFIRLQGCPVGCSWCDTKHTWEIDGSKRVPFGDVICKTVASKSWVNISADELALYCKNNFTAKHVVITGGEPCIYNLKPLCEILERFDFKVQVETSGTHPIYVSDQTWVTVSPKIGMIGGCFILNSSIDRANEIKHPVGTEKDIKKLDNLIVEFNVSSDVIISLQPISQKKHATNLAVQTCIKRNWRLSIQMHKYIEID